MSADRPMTKSSVVKVAVSTGDEKDAKSIATAATMATSDSASTAAAEHELPVLRRRLGLEPHRQREGSAHGTSTNTRE